MNNGFIGLRRAFINHLVEGRVTSREFSAFCLILAAADHKTGIWIGSAKHLSSLYGAGDVNERLARYLLESLECKGYIKRFAKRRSKGNYPIAIDKFECSDGAHRGHRLNASATTDWRSPVYDILPSDRQRSDLQGCIESAVQPTSKQEIEKKKTREKNIAQTSLLRDGFDEFWAIYPRKVGKKPAQEAWEKVRPEEVDAILRSAEQWKQTDQWRENVRFIPHPTTFLNQRRWEDEIPAPQPARRKGRLYGEELTEHNLRVAGFLGRRPDSPASRPVRGALPAANHTGPDKALA